MTIMQQMNLFNTSSEVAGFKLDYLEVWNWGTFDKKVYHMNLHGNNSLLTGANASGKSTLIDALLTLMVPLKRQRFYNQSSGVEKKGNRTEESYFFGNYGNQQQEGAAQPNEGHKLIKELEKDFDVTVITTNTRNIIALTDLGETEKLSNPMWTAGGSILGKSEERS